MSYILLFDQFECRIDAISYFQFWNIKDWKQKSGHLYEIVFDLQSAKIIIFGSECNYGQQDDDNKKYSLFE